MKLVTIGALLWAAIIVVHPSALSLGLAAFSLGLGLAAATQRERGRA